MSDFQPRFAIGDRVWVAEPHHEHKRYPCPDCNDTKKWKAENAAGEVFMFSCPRCQRSSGLSDPFRLDYYVWTPHARLLTIGQIEGMCVVDGAGTRTEFKYMCTETGVGSGLVYREDQLFLTEKEALAEAQKKCDKENSVEREDPRVMKGLEYSRMPSLNCLIYSLEREIKEELTKKYTSDILDGESINGITPGLWLIRGEQGSDDVITWYVDAHQDGDNSRQVCSGYGGLSQGFATKEHGPGNALVISIAPIMAKLFLNYRDGDWLAFPDNDDLKKVYEVLDKIKLGAPPSD